MRISIFLTIFLASCSNKLSISGNQGNNCNGDYDPNLKKRVYKTVDEMPEYPGGQVELLKDILKNIDDPDQEAVQGSIKLTLIIDVDGNVKGEKIYNKAVKEYTPLDKEVLRVIKLIPKWKPGKCNKQKVPVRVFVPIQINR